MNKTKKITLNGRNITVNEVTVAQIEEWEEALLNTENVEVHILDKMMNRSLPVSAIRICVPDLTDEDLLVAPTEIENVYDAVEEVNPFFLKYVEQMVVVGEKLLTQSLSTGSV
ncbi:MAG: hypothetical protein COA36_11750 [Desulfotalea sp.]|nr:MAG: hypothetical protein COA36_11750 [Desulfotalea sp.]